MVFSFEGLSGAELLAEFEGLFEGEHAGGAGAVEEGGCSGTDSELESIAEIPVFVEAEEHTGAECVTCAGGSGDVFCGDVEGHAAVVFALAGAEETAFGEMDGDEFADSELEYCPGGVFEEHGVELSVGVAEFESSDFSGFEFVDNAVVDVLECRGDDLDEAVAIFADDVEAGFHAGFLGCGEQAGCLGAPFPVGGIECIEEEEVAEVEDAGLVLGEVDVFTVPQGVCAPVVEERAAAPLGFRHDIGVGGIGGGGRFQVPGIDFVLFAVLEDFLAEWVFADESGAGEGEGGAEFGEVDEDVIGASSGALFLGEDISEGFWAGIDVDLFDLVDDPVSSGEEPFAGDRRGFLHGLGPCVLAGVHGV